MPFPSQIKTMLEEMGGRINNLEQEVQDLKEQQLLVNLRLH